MLCNLKDQHSHILSCMPHPINPIPASSAFKAMKLVFMPPFPVPCSEGVFSSLPFSYSANLLSAFWHTPTILFWPSTSSPTYFYKQNPSVILMYFTHATPSLTLPLNTNTSYPATDATPYILPAEHRSSSVQLFLYFCLSVPQEKIELAPRNSLPTLRKKQKAWDTSKPHYRHQAEALPKPPHTQLSATFSLEWEAAWHLTSFLAFPAASRWHPYFHASFPASATQAYQ